MTEQTRRGTITSPASPTEDVQIRRLLDQFSRNLVDLRALGGRSQMEVAAIAGLHRTEIGLLENRKRMPMIATARNWVRIWLLVAPRARRSPISERRSSTEMIMMLATPTAPTSSPGRQPDRKRGTSQRSRRVDRRRSFGRRPGRADQRREQRSAPRPGAGGGTRPPPTPCSSPVRAVSELRRTPQLRHRFRFPLLLFAERLFRRRFGFRGNALRF
jgi:DNA-binding XRE family transcriptional regulator